MPFAYRPVTVTDCLDSDAMILELDMERKKEDRKDEAAEWSRRPTKETKRGGLVRKPVADTTKVGKLRKDSML